jgi:chromosome segregation ATPase
MNTFLNERIEKLGGKEAMVEELRKALSEKENLINRQSQECKTLELETNSLKTEIDTLTNQMKALQKGRQVNEEAWMKEKAEYVNTIAKLNEEINVVVDSLVILKKDLETREEEIRLQRNELKNLIELNDLTEKTLIDLREARDSAEKQILQVNETVQTLSSEKASLQEELRKSNEQRQDMVREHQTAMNEMAREIQELTQKVEALTAGKAFLQKEIDDNKISRLEDEKAALQAQQQLRDLIQTKEKDNILLKEKLSVLENQISTTKDQLEDVNTRLEQLKIEAIVKDRELTELKLKLEFAQKEFGQKLETEKENIRKEMSSVRRRSEVLDSNRLRELEQLKSEKEQWQTTVAELQQEVQRLLEKTKTDVIKQGWLHKQGGVVRSWKHRYFTLLNTGEMKYYDRVAPAPKGVIPADRIYKIIPAEEKTGHTKHSFKFMVSGKDREYFFSCETANDMKAWLDALQSISAYHRSQTLLEAAPSTSASTSAPSLPPTNTGSRLSFRSN